MAKFREDGDEAEFHILGAYWALLPREDPQNQRRIVNDSERSADLKTGVLAAKRASTTSGCPGGADLATQLRDGGIDQDGIIRVRTRASDLLFLLAVGDERLHQGDAPAAWAAARNESWTG